MAELLRHFAAGLLTNDDFEDQLYPIIARPLDISADPALWAIRTRAWFLYDDIRRHRLTGKWALTREGRREVARWIVFLHSDCEYEWPIKSFMSLTAFALNLLTLGLGGLIVGRVLRRRYDKIGEWDVWPFIRRRDFESALRQPRLLSGSKTGHS